MIDIFLRFSKCVFVCDFRIMELSGIIAITNSNVDSKSPMKISLRIFPSAKLSPLAVYSTLQFGFLNKMYDFVGYLVHLRQSTILLCGTMLYSFSC